MGQNFKILISQNVANTSISSNSGLTLNNGYYSYNQTGLNKGVVTEFNVRQFLDDPNNSDVSTGFFNYLNENTTIEEMREINESNKKLSDLFKKYYNTSILVGTESPTSYINLELIATSSHTISDYYNYDLNQTVVTENVMTGTSASLNPVTRFINNQKEELTTFTLEQSYYLPVNLTLTVGETSKLNFKEEFGKDEIVERNNQPLIFLKQGFVLLNKQVDQNVFWKD